MTMRSWFRKPFTRPITRTIRNAPRRFRLTLDTLEDRLVPASLNSTIDSILAEHFTSNPPSGQVQFDVAEATVGTTVGGGTADLELTNVSLTFSNVDFASGKWAGNVAVTAQAGVLFPGLLDIPVEDDGTDTGNDADLFGVVGEINLSVGNSTSQLKLDNLDAETLGWPQFLDISFNQLELNFTDFRRDDNLNSLHLEAALTGFDTGDDDLNDLLSSDNPLYGLTILGSAATTLDVKAIEDTALAVGGVNIKAAFAGALASATALELDGLAGQLSGKLFSVGDFNAAFIYNTVTVDPDAAGPLPERSASYLAVEGSFAIGDEKLGGRSAKFDIAFAISELGPLQFFVSGGPIKRFEPTTGLTIEEVHLGVRFNTTIEELQTETDFTTTSAQVVPDGTEFLVTLTIPDHDLALGDRFRIKDAGNSFYDGKFEVAAVNADEVTYRVANNPGTFVGSANIIRLTITDALDLRDEGLESGIATPGDIFIWRDQLDLAVTNQVKAGANIWSQMFGDVVIGGGATLSIDPIPDTVMQLKVDLLIDTDLRILMTGNMSLADGLVEIPVKLYADLSDLFDGSGRFLFLADIGKAPVIDPLLVMRSEVSFAPLPGEAGFRIATEGGYDLNIPAVTTLTLQGKAALEVRLPAAGPDEVLMDFTFDTTLSETNFGNIGAANGAFHLSIDKDVPVDASHPVGGVQVWGAALLTTNFDFLHPVGLFASASGLLRINSSSAPKPAEALKDVNNQPILVALPAHSFALRLDGSVDFRIDSDSPKDGFQTDESVFQIAGNFVLEFSPLGFNVGDLQGRRHTDPQGRPADARAARQHLARVRCPRLRGDSRR